MERRQLLGGIAAVAAGAWALPARADGWPDRTITLIVPFAPGGNLDVVARTIAPALGQALGQSVIVDNRAGAGGAIGASFVARAKADGYTLLVSTPNALVVSPLITKTTYKLADFAPIGAVATTPLVVVVKNEPAKYADIAALLKAARDNPGKVTAGHAGAGTTNHVALLQLEQAGKLSLSAVPYKGSAPALSDLLGGQIDLVVDQLTSSANLIRSGALKAVAVMSRDRDPGLPNVPTLREAGLADFEATTATGLLAPAGTPPAVLARLNAALHTALDDATVKRNLAAVGSPGRASTTPEWLATLQREQAGAQALQAAHKLESE